MFDLVQISGYVPVSMQFLKMDKSLTRNLLHNLIIRNDVSSCPYALLMLSPFIIFNMTFSSKENEESLVVETYCSELGTINQSINQSISQSINQNIYFPDKQTRKLQFLNQKLQVMI